MSDANKFPDSEEIIRFYLLALAENRRDKISNIWFQSKYPGVLETLRLLGQTTVSQEPGVPQTVSRSVTIL